MQKETPVYIRSIITPAVVQQLLHKHGVPAEHRTMMTKIIELYLQYFDDVEQFPPAVRQYSVDTNISPDLAYSALLVFSSISQNIRTLVQHALQGN